MRCAFLSPLTRRYDHGLVAFTEFATQNRWLSDVFAGLLEIDHDVPVSLAHRPIFDLPDPPCGLPFCSKPLGDAAAAAVLLCQERE